MNFVLTILIVFAVLVLSEAWWRHQKIPNEFSRKLVHISVGSFVAFWPFFLSWNDIKILSITFLVVVSVSKYLRVFRSIHSVQRPTLGELYFAIAVGAIAFVTHDKWIYMAALLQMSLADGLAAVIGTRYGSRHKYAVFGQSKSIIGTTTFFIVTIVILVVYATYAPGERFQLAFIGLAAVSTALENLAIAGLDNLIVPIFAAAVLNFYR